METGSLHPMHWRVVLQARLSDISVCAQLKSQLDWDEAHLNAVAAGRTGIKLSEIDRFFRIIGLTAMRKDLFDAYVVMAQVGAECAAAHAQGRCS